MIDIQAVEQATERLEQRGIRVLNAFLLGHNERSHAQRLLELMAPAQGAVVLDAGCGVGELARLMQAERPDLTFWLLNVIPGQLALCPDRMRRINAPYEATGLPDESVDMVLFAFSICHAGDWLTTLREAYRVLKPGGQVFIFDMARINDEGSDTVMRERYQAAAFRPSAIMDVAQRAGLELADPADAIGHQPVVYRMREVVEEPAVYDAAFAGVIPLTLKLRRMPWAPPVASAFARHQRIAFQFSGGRDSTAALWLLKPYWSRMDVYHLDTGDQFPETRAVVDAIQEMLPRPMIIITSDVHAVREQHGFASDVVPVDNTQIGRLVSGRVVKIISRYECCARSLMQPMHQRMLADGITLIVRGQRDDEYSSPPKRSGDVEGGVEVLYPIQHLKAADVDRILRDNHLPVAPFYERGMKRAPECMGCTAWWDEGRAAYLKANHPQAYAQYTARMRQVRGEIDRQLSMLEA